MPVGEETEEMQIFQTVGIGPEKVIVIDLKRSLEVGGMISIEISGGIRPWMFDIPGKGLSLQVICISGELGNYGADSEVGVSWKSRRNLRL